VSSREVKQEILNEFISCVLDVETAFRACRVAGERLSKIEDELRWWVEEDEPGSEDDRD